MSLVRFDPGRLPPGHARRYPFKLGATYVFLGEIPNMSGHCVVADARNGKIHVGYQTENFAELPESGAEVGLPSA